jgi:hypothetical protein
LNTIFDGRVWNALATAYPDHYQPNLAQSGFFQRLVQSRQGYAGSSENGTAVYDFDSRYPTVFASPFRSGGTSLLVPQLTSGAEWEVGVQGTLLREAFDQPGTPLFARPLQDSYPDYRNPISEPQFYTDGIQRLVHLTTIRSNVFAVWITVGYFDVDIWTRGGSGETQVFDVMHPDGLALGEESRSQIGDAVRHRGFFLIDRTVPVGFAMELNHNVKDTIILSRFIE